MQLADILKKTLAEDKFKKFKFVLGVQAPVELRGHMLKINLNMG